MKTLGNRKEKMNKEIKSEKYQREGNRKRVTKLIPPSALVSLLVSSFLPQLLPSFSLNHTTLMWSCSDKHLLLFSLLSPPLSHLRSFQPTFSLFLHQFSYPILTSWFMASSCSHFHPLSVLSCFTIHA